MISHVHQSKNWPNKPLVHSTSSLYSGVNQLPVTNCCKISFYENLFYQVFFVPYTVVMYISSVTLAYQDMLSKLLNSMTSHLSLTTIVTKVLTVSCAGSHTHYYTATPPVGWSLQQWTLQRCKGFDHGNAGDIQLWRSEFCMCVLAAQPSGKAIARF